ncbi:MAG: efflux RND transporter periplasmic adaptor subunit [Prevotellaceae bacterium]|jgi:HlyD family secretion protein|nr:efflux RND transporter periplasmic adaptor subunit [Prevotellaceae bacterium]
MKTKNTFRRLFSLGQLGGMGLLLLSCGGGSMSDAYGNFEATEIIVSAQAAGQILQLVAREGALLQAGEQVGLIDTVDLFLQKQVLLAQAGAVAAQFPILQAQADVQRQQIKNMENDFARIKNMWCDGAATQKQYDDMEGAWEVAKRQLAATESQRIALHSQQETIRRQAAQVDNNIAKCRIENPRTGTVLVSYAEAGELAAPGKALYKVGDLSEMKLKVYISEAQLAAVKIGQPVEVLIDAPDGGVQPMEGTVCWIAGKAEFTPKIIQTRDERVNLVYAVKVAVKNDGRIKIGMPGEVKFSTNFYLAGAPADL